MTQERIWTQPSGPGLTLAADAAERAVRARSRYARMHNAPKSEASGDSEYALASAAAVHAAQARSRLVAAEGREAPASPKRAPARSAGLLRRAMRVLFEEQRILPVGALNG